jgi:hypothetical protein
MPSPDDPIEELSIGLALSMFLWKHLPQVLPIYP